MGDHGEEDVLEGDAALDRLTLVSERTGRHFDGNDQCLVTLWGWLDFKVLTEEDYATFLTNERLDWVLIPVRTMR